MADATYAPLLLELKYRLVKADNIFQEIAKTFMQMEREYADLEMVDALASTVSSTFKDLLDDGKRDNSINKIVYDGVVEKYEYINYDTISKLYKEIMNEEVDSRFLSRFSNLFKVKIANNQKLTNYCLIQGHWLDGEGIITVAGGEHSSTMIRLAHRWKLFKDNLDDTKKLYLSQIVTYVFPVSLLFTFIESIRIPLIIITGLIGLVALWLRKRKFAYMMLVAAIVVTVVSIITPMIEKRDREQMKGTVRTVIDELGAKDQADSKRKKATPAPMSSPIVAPTKFIVSNWMLSFRVGEIAAREGKPSPAVYTGPGEDYYRVGNSKVYFGGKIGCAGYENGWYFIWYNSDGQKKIGWTKMKNTDIETKVVPQIDFSQKVTVTIQCDCNLTDGKDIYGHLMKGQLATYLGVIDTSEIVKGVDKMAYVEVAIDGVKRRGLVPYESIPWK